MDKNIDVNLLAAIKRLCESEEIDCFGGGCGIFAVALNRLLGGSDEEMVFWGAYNPRMEKKYDERMYFHVGLVVGKLIVDGTGITSKDNLLSFVETDEGGSARLRKTDGADVLQSTDAVTFYGRVGSDGLESEIERVQDIIEAALASPQ